MTVVKHCDHASDDVAFRDKAEIAGVDGVLLVDSLQPVVIRFGAGLETRNKQRAVFCTNGIARNGSTAGYTKPIDRIAGNGEGHDIALFDGLAQQATIGQQPVALNA